MEKKVVFFDVDETLLNCKSMFSFVEFFIQNKYKNNSSSIFKKFSCQIQEKVMLGITRENLNIFFYTFCKGFNQNEVLALSSKWYFFNKISEDFFIKKSIQFLKNKKKEGYLVAAISGSSYDILHEFIHEYQFDAYFFSEPEVENGIYTGKLLNCPMIGKYKAYAVSSFMKREKIRLEDCIAIGDHESDIPMLRCAGTAYLVKNNELCLFTSLFSQESEHSGGG